MANSRDPNKAGLVVYVPRALRDLAGEVAAANGSNRTAVVEGFLRWYVGEPGAVLPVPAQRAPQVQGPED